MPKRLQVLDRHRHHRQLQATTREIPIGQANPGQRLHPSLLQPGQIGPMPHHPGMVGVLGQHPAAQRPLATLHHGLHGSGLGVR